jgi:ribosomal protein S18 acetylase RimI-like enzyme
VGEGKTIQFEKAKPEDAKALALASWRAFDADVNYGAPGKGGPPGYKSDQWQLKMMVVGNYYKMLLDGRIIGGFIVMLKGYRYYEVVRIFIHPEFQNRGIGARAFEFLWGEYPDVERWTLGTPAWNLRNRHFYEKAGFAEVGEDRHGGILFERNVIPD